MNVIEQELMQNCLKRGDEYANKDKTLFLNWQRGKVETEEAMNIFIDNNDVSRARASQLTIKLFEDWLKSIGWNRR